MPDDQSPLFQKSVRAGEAGHWYNRDGTPCWGVKSADGKKMIEPDIRHARKHNLVPGVTSIISCAERPQLTVWRVEQAILASLTLPRRPHEPDREYLRRVYDDSQEQSKRAAALGTAIHAAVEQHLTGRWYDPAMRPYVDGVCAILTERYGARVWLCEQSFADPMGYGSKIDLESEDGEIIIDMKGKEFTADKLPSAYDEHGMQLAAYHRARKFRARQVSNLFISRNEPGLCHIHEWNMADDTLQRCTVMFSALHAYWCARNKYQPGWAA